MSRDGERNDVESCRAPETWPARVGSKAHECSAYSVKRCYEGGTIEAVEAIDGRHHALSEVHVPKAAVGPQIRDWSFRWSPRLSQLMSDDLAAMASWG